MLKAIAVALSLVSVPVLAGTHSIGAGYMQDSASPLDDLKGLHIKYSYYGEQWGIVSTISSSYSETVTRFTSRDRAEVEASKVSALIGAGYKPNPYVNIYALVGVAKAKLTGKREFLYGGYQGVVYGVKETTEKDTAFAYGAGIEAAISEHVALYAGYEGSHLFDSKVNSFNTGITYKF